MTDVTARPWWRWMRGMLTIGGLRVDGTSPEGRPVRYERTAEVYGFRDMERPSETDPATLGCLTQRARDLWGDPTLSAWRSDCDEVWYVRCRRGYMTARGSTEWAALVAACDAAPSTLKETP